MPRERQLEEEDGSEVQQGRTAAIFYKVARDDRVREGERRRARHRWTAASSLCVLSREFGLLFLFDGGDEVVYWATVEGQYGGFGVAEDVVFAGMT